MSLLAAGKTCKEAAAALHISARTLEHCLERLKQRYSQARLHSLVAHIVRLRLLGVSLVMSSVYTELDWLLAS